MTFLAPGTDPETSKETPTCTSLVIYNPSVYDLSIEVAEESKLYELPENKAAYEMLLDMLRYKRPHGSKTERKFINEFIHKVGTLGKDLRTDAFGNYSIRIGDAPVLWSSHTDTVHSNKGMQELGWDGDEVGVSREDPSDCLGADDTAGVWLMVQMIEQRVPGLYIFHRGEEKGCLGSKYITTRRKEFVKDIKFAIALDRKGTKDVITHQRGKRTCSDAFAKSLAEQLGMGYVPDNGGVYTDTAEYIDIVPECTNLSVGYHGAHGRYERLNLEHIFALRDALFKIDLSKLVEERVAGTTEYKHYNSGNSYNSGGNYNGSDSYYYGSGVTVHSGGSTRRYGEGGYWEAGTWHPYREGTKEDTRVFGGKSWWQTQKEAEEAAAAKRRTHSASSSYNGTHSRQTLLDDLDDDEDDTTSGNDYDVIVDLVKANPEAVADILEQFGMSARQLAQEILEAVGIVNHTRS